MTSSSCSSDAPKTATLALLGLQSLSRESDASTLPYGALAAPAKLPRGARATAKLLVLKEKPQVRACSLAGSGFGDEHVPALLEVLHGSECAIAELDLSFNPRLTDGGLLQLAETLGREGLAAHDLVTLRLGACNATSEASRQAVEELLTKKRPDVTLDFAPTLQPVAGWQELRDAQSYGINRLLQVGKVFPDSPASAAGLLRGDFVVQMGTLTFAGTERNRGFKSEAERHLDAIEYFRGVAESLKPLVLEQAAVGGEIDLIVQRGEQHVPLLLRPAKWGGEGLLGCKMGLPG